MSTGNTNWDRMTQSQRITAAAVDIMAHSDFALLSGVVMMGKAEFVKDVLPPEIELDMPDGTKQKFSVQQFTAATDGQNEWYGENFMGLQNRKQHRWVRLHENFHKALHHCVDYTPLVKKYPQLCNIAQDYVINAMIDELDPQQAFAERPVGFDGQPLQICLDKKYYGWSFIEVLRDLLKQCKGGGKGKTGGMDGEGGNLPGAGQPFDIHVRGTGEKMTHEAKEKLKGQIEDALRQGKILADKMAGREKGGHVLDGMIQQRRTDWREPLRHFVSTICAGDENSRFCPPNKRMLPLGFLMPSHFSEATGELHIYCDTSGSMGGVYPVVFGEIARICETVRPEKVRVIWWDTAVCGEQVFEPKDYDNIGSLMKPEGGGGTHPNCVVQYVTQKNYKPKAGIFLTDGYLDGSGSELPWPVLWGVVDNPTFQPPQGTVVRIDSQDV